MKKLGTAPSKTLVMAASIAMSFACGGGDEGNDTELGDADRLAGNGGSGGTGTVTVPDICQRQAECPSGYVCVPPAESFTEVLDQDCYDTCALPCQGSPLVATCEQNCTLACTTQVPPPDGSLNGKCLANEDGSGGSSGGGTGGSGDGSGGTTNDPGPAIQWANTWTVDVEYTVNCDWANTSHQSGTQKYTVTMVVTGSNSTPKATLSGGYELEGTGGDDRMTLTGDFPLRNWDGDTATPHTLNSPNEATIRMTTVESATEATGTIEGSWDASGGWECTTSDGKITLSR